MNLDRNPLTIQRHFHIELRKACIPRYIYTYINQFYILHSYHWFQAQLSN